MRPPMHRYGGYAGPWVENYFYYRYLTDRRLRKRVGESGFEYLPIAWTDFAGRVTPQVKGGLRRWMEQLSPERRYFTIDELPHHGLRAEVPDNVLVFAAGAKGDFGIPMLKHPVRRRVVEKRWQVGFMGGIGPLKDHQGIRSEILRVFSDRPGFANPREGTYREFLEFTRRCRYTLCPRGYGPTSFRMYEALALGSVPVYIWEELCWLPFQDSVDWDRLAVVVPRAEVPTLPARLEAISDAEYADKIAYGNDCWKQSFTYDGVCENICRILEGIGASPATSA